MEIPVGMPISMPAQVIATGRMPPLVLSGTVKRFDGSTYEIEVRGDAAALAPGDVLVLDLADAPLVQGRVDTIEGASLRLAVERTRPRDPREFPRTEGELGVRYQVAAAGLDEGALDAWMEQAWSPDEAAWRRPARLVDWSASGLGFLDPATCDEGDRVLLEIAPPGAVVPWRAVGRVIRAAPLGDDAPGGEAAMTHSYAVDFERASAEVREGLLGRTIETQQLPGEDDAGADAP